MKEWPPLNDAGDLPTGVHAATLTEVIERFGMSNPRRATVSRRLERIYVLVRATGRLARFVIFGSFVTAKAEPNDVDIFLLMDDAFDVSKVTGETAILFNHLPRRITRVPAFSGSGVSRQWVANKPPSSIGRSNATALAAV